MSGTPLRVDVYVYPTIIRLHGMSLSKIEQQAKAISTNLQTSNLFTSFNVNPRLFEYYNVKFTEKQVKRIDENFYNYSLGTKFSLYVPPQNPPRRLRYLIRKYFSGDVSGDIGESLLAYFLVEEMKIRSYCIGHIRPEKRRGFLTPDFIVWDSSYNLRSFLQKKKYPLPILVEVKGFTGQVDSVRISHALSQLKMLIVNTSLIGLIFMATRNEQRQGYDVYVGRVEK